MASKRPASSTVTDVKPKRARKSLNLEMKLVIVRRHEGGEGTNFIARTLGLPQSTVSTVIKKGRRCEEGRRDKHHPHGEDGDEGERGNNGRDGEVAEAVD